MKELLKKKIQQEDLKKFWSGELTIESLAELYGVQVEDIRNYILYETDVGRLLLLNVKEFRSEINKLIQGEIKQVPLLVTAPVEEATKVFTKLCNLFEESQSTAEKLLVARELREYIKLIISFHESGIVEDKEKKLSEMKSAYKEIFIE